MLPSLLSTRRATSAIATTGGGEGGIVLLDVVGKVVARVLQERLQRLAEQELPESHHSVVSARDGAARI